MRAGGPLPKHRGLVLARDSERVIGAFRPRRWNADPNDGRRWYFNGEPADSTTQMRYVGKAVPVWLSKSRIRFVIATHNPASMVCWNDHPPLWDNGHGGRSAVKSPVLPTGDNRPAREEPILEQQEPVVTESALADALDQLVNLIEELRVDVNLRVEITTDDTQLLKLNFSGTPDVGFSLQGEVRDIPGVVVRRVWNEGLRDYDTLYRSGNSV